MLEARPGCGHAQARRRLRLPWHLTSILLVLSPFGCERLIGIDRHDFAKDPPGTVGGGGAAQESGGEAGHELGGGDSSLPAGGRGGRDGGAGGRGGGTGGRMDGGRGGIAGAPAEMGGSAPVDSISPRVVSYTPDGESEGVDAGEPIRIEFSEAMAVETVVAAYAQVPGRPTRFEWTEGNTVLTVTPGLDPPLSTWSDGEQPGEPSDLLVTYRLDGRAQDPAKNPLVSPLSASYLLKRRVDHRLSPCLDLSGFVSADSFTPAAPVTDPPCVVSSSGPVSFRVGDSGGAAVVTVLSFSLRAVPANVELSSAVLVFEFDAPVGMPHVLYGTLVLEEVALGTWVTDGSTAPAISSLGVLSDGSVRDPRKDVEAPVARALAEGDRNVLVQFRVRFEGLVSDGNDSPDYARLGGGSTAMPTLLLTYDCTRCP